MTRITATVQPVDGPAVPALPLAGDAEGARLALPWEVAPPLAVGQTVEVTLDAGAPFVAVARLVEVDALEDALEVALAWAAPERVRVLLPGGLRQALDAVAARRDRRARAAVRLGGAWVGALRDLSADDLTLEVEAPVPLAPGDRVTCRLDLPDGGDPLAGPARVVRLVEQGGTAGVGLAWEGPEAALQRIADRIDGWLLSRRARAVRAS